MCNFEMCYGYVCENYAFEHNGKCNCRARRLGCKDESTCPEPRQVTMKDEE